MKELSLLLTFRSRKKNRKEIWLRSPVSRFFLKKKNLSDLIKSSKVPFKGLCVAVLRGRRNSIQKAGRTLGASQLLSFPRQRTHVCQWHSPLCGPRRPSSAELATGSEAQQGVGILPKIQYPYFSPMNWPRLGLHCYLCIVLMAFLSSSLPSFLIP